MKRSAVEELTDQVESALRLHPGTRDLTPNEFRVLRYIYYVAFLHGMQSWNGKIYCVPSEQRIASVVGLHRVTVSRIVSYLKLQGLLTVIQRRPKNGQWQTNLYKLGSIVWIMFGKIIKRFQRYFNRVASKLHKGTKDESTYTKIRSNTAFNQKKLQEWQCGFTKAFYERHPELV
jgi:hypothetical protein